MVAALPRTVRAWESQTYAPTSETALFALTNQARAKVGLPSLRNDTALHTIARWRSKDMGDRGYFSHQIPPSGAMVFTYMTKRGYCYIYAGENIGWSTYPDETATQVIQQMFMDSPTHRDNILNAKWKAMGIGAYQAANGKKLWTVLFSKPCASATSTTSKPKPTASVPWSSAPNT
mgnify:FL=1